MMVPPGQRNVTPSQHAMYNRQAPTVLQVIQSNEMPRNFVKSRILSIFCVFKDVFLYIKKTLSIVQYTQELIFF